MKDGDMTPVDLRSLSRDTRVLLRWVARDECSMDDEARYLTHPCNPLVGVDEDLLRRVRRKLGRLRLRLDAHEAKCLRLIIQAVELRLGAANLKDVDALMRGYYEG